MFGALNWQQSFSCFSPMNLITTQWPMLIVFWLHSKPIENAHLNPFFQYDLWSHWLFKQHQNTGTTFAFHYIGLCAAAIRTRITIAFMNLRYIMFSYRKDNGNRNNETKLWISMGPSTKHQYIVYTNCISLCFCATNWK